MGSLVGLVPLTWNEDRLCRLRQAGSPTSTRARPGRMTVSYPAAERITPLAPGAVLLYVTDKQAKRGAGQAAGTAVWLQLVPLLVPVRAKEGLVRRVL